MQVRSFSQGLYFYIISGFFSGFIISLFVFLIVAGGGGNDMVFLQIRAALQSYPLLWFFIVLPILSSLLFAYFFIFNRERLKHFVLETEKQKVLKDKALALAKNMIGNKLSYTERAEGDELLESLDLLRLNLIESEKRAKQLQEEQARRQWSSEGLTLFGDILRNQSEDLKSMAYSLIRNLVNHLNANQGGFFLTEMDDTGEKHFNMLACYAYGRDKYAGKHYPYDEGLMGMCAREKKMIYMTDVPQGYLEITSGLGKANPDSLIILPLLDQNEVKGIIELASFQEIEGYQREFLETLAENIAISLSNIQNSFKTKQLLEETRKQAESLSLKDEQMRKNMEELRSTQKQAAEQAEEFISFSNTVNHTLIRAEFDTDGTLLYANTKFLRKLGYSGNRDVEGKSILMFIDDKDRDWFNRIWESLAVGGKHFEGYMKHVTMKGQDLWTMSTYTCVRKEDGSVDKILFLAIDTTEQKKQSLDYEGQIEAINRLVLKSEFTPDGKILNVNERFLDTLGFRRQEIEHGSIFDFLHHRDLETISELWERIITGKPHRGQIRLLTRTREEKWFMASLSSVSDMYGEVYKVIFLANEITNEKTMEDEAQKQMQNLKTQEETYRLENIELKEKLEKDKKDHAVQKEEFIQKINIYKQLLNSLDDIILISDNHGILSFINNSGLRFFGVKTLEVIDKPIPALLEDFQEPQEKELLMSLLDSTSKAKGNRKIRLSDREGEKRNYAFSRDMIERDQKIFHIYSIRPN